MAITSRKFGEICGVDVTLFELKNDSGVTVEVLNYGGYLRSWNVLQKSGKFVDILLGYEDLEGYLTDAVYLGAIVGRVCNRIKHGKFTLEGRDYNLVTNNGPHHLHGGINGFFKKIWDARIEGNKLILHCSSADGDEGYPGLVECDVTYELTNQNELRISYKATTTKATPIMLTSHAYFNLCGEGTPTVDNHEASIFSDKSLPTDSNALVTGVIEPVEGTLSDLRKGVKLGDVLPHFKDPNQHFPSDFDRYFCVENDGKLKLVAKCKSLSTNIELEVFTDQPGVNFYTGAYLNQVGKGGNKYGMQAGLCFETHSYPDAVNNAHFPSIVLQPGKEYKHTCVYKCKVP